MRISVPKKTVGPRVRTPAAELPGFDLKAGTIRFAWSGPTQEAQAVTVKIGGNFDALLTELTDSKVMRGAANPTSRRDTDFFAIQQGDTRYVGLTEDPAKSILKLAHYEGRERGITRFVAWVVGEKGVVTEVGLPHTTEGSRVRFDMMRAAGKGFEIVPNAF